MNIGLFGYGKMGRAIEEIALAQGHSIAWRLTRDNRTDATSDWLRQADVAIEFTRPEAAFGNVMLCLEAGLPVVSGTTGWLARLPDARAYCLGHQGAMLWASNFSIGVNLFFALNRYASQLMNERSEYAPALTEIHHIHKLDAPSGTAISLLLDLVAAVQRYNDWTLAPTPPNPDSIPVTALREGEVPGTHRVIWAGPHDEITLEHRAHSRKGFAAGAVQAAEWLVGKTGFFEMKDMLGLS